MMRDGLCGTGADCCCYVNGVRCPHVVETPNDPTYNFACGIFQKYETPALSESETWLLVHADADYLTDVKPTWIAKGVDDCGVYQPSNTCPDCGQEP